MSLFKFLVTSFISFFVVFFPANSYAPNNDKLKPDFLASDCKTAFEKLGAYKGLFSETGALHQEFSSLLTTYGFKTWYSKQGRPANETTVPTELVVKYLQEVHQTKFEGTEYGKKLRNESLSYALEAIGIEVKEGQDPFKLLARLSKKNRERILRNVEVESGEEFALEDALIANLVLNPVHNTTGAAESISSPLLSSTQMKQFGLTRLNQATPFNRDFLETADQVFFFGQFGRKGDFPKQNNEGVRYGTNSVYLNREYARKNGWVSPFVMDPDNLITHGITTIGSNIPKSDQVSKKETDALVKKIGPASPEMVFNSRRLFYLLRKEGVELETPLYSKHLKRLNIPADIESPQFKAIDKSMTDEKTPNPDIVERLYSDEWSTISAIAPKTWDRLKALQKHYQFTPEDFQSIVQTQLRKRIRELKSSSSEEDQVIYGLAIKTLRSGNHQAISTLLTHLVFEPLKMPTFYELKVPAYVDIEGLVHPAQ